nr:ATP-binding protein [Saprospiraceae bacterium]
VFILQPLLENAIKYGVESKGKIHICLNAKIIQDNLQITITDDGPGIQPSKGSGIGLKNTLERLENHYRDHFKFELQNRDDGGLSIRIEIPLPRAA